MKAVTWLLATALALALPAVGAQTVTAKGAEFAERIETEAGPLTLAGTGVAKYRVLFTVYAAALHVPEGTPRESLLAEDTPRSLTIEYFYDIDAADLARAADEVLERQLDDSERATIADAVDRLHRLYRPVSEGDRYRMTYLPGTGTRLALNGEVLGTVAGAAFARAYFGIWLAEGALSDSLRTALTEGLEPAG
ncbi:chalcone isomerase family protein [Arhodomonas sp. SL1]|uniref:chalcone isomerase family protein n=1 Tax=Arhodomonas sp. SL1 TaxID=3425691 RepID=UPI003F881361